MADKVSREVLHYREKPETFISSTINCGVYLLNKSVFPIIKSVLKERQVRDILSEKETSNWTFG